TMTSPTVIVYLTCLVLGEVAWTVSQKLSPSVRHERREAGESLTLTCDFKDDYSSTSNVYWYKQTIGEKLSYSSDGEFKDNPRFTLNAQNGQYNLTISDLNMSDSATYHCISCFSLNIPAVVHQTASETIEPGGSVTLSCTVHPGTCDGEHSVYWFKNSHPGFIYTHGGKNDQCVRKANSQTNTCTYNLPMKNLNISNTGTYYCAVASCGHILFGNGTKLDSGDGLNSPALVYFLSGALIFATILIVIMAFLLYKMNKRNRLLSQGMAANTAYIFLPIEADNLFYATLNVNMPNTSRRQRNTTKDCVSECVYSSVKQ
uniref:Ig-like domain-containing protein n=1 Tax=Labrus bergylta TaxID=56723 RepID=A0A3Q3GZG7_9LABR